MFSCLMPGIFLTVRRNLVSVLFPTLCAWAIYADWSRTQKYKAVKAKKLEADTNLQFEQPQVSVSVLKQTNLHSVYVNLYLSAQIGATSDVNFVYM